VEFRGDGRECGENHEECDAEHDERRAGRDRRREGSRGRREDHDERGGNNDEFPAVLPSTSLSAWVAMVIRLPVRAGKIAKLPRTTTRSDEAAMNLAKTTTFFPSNPTTLAHDVLTSTPTYASPREFPRKKGRAPQRRS
jgi:hypothetical protein